MVKEFGMSRLGRVNFHEGPGPIFLQGAPTLESDRAYSERTAREIDVEVRRIIDQATGEVRDVLQARRNALEAIAQRLMEKEVMDGAELRQLLEQCAPGPRLVPGSAAIVPAPPEEPAPRSPSEPLGGTTGIQPG
jgi:cell division protease FtsH